MTKEQQVVQLQQENQFLQQEHERKLQEIQQRHNAALDDLQQEHKRELQTQSLQSKVQQLASDNADASKTVVQNLQAQMLQLQQQMANHKF